MTEPTPDLAAELARRLGIDTTDTAMTQLVADVLADAEADVEAYLGRPIRPVTRTATGCWPLLGGWDIPGERGRIREITSSTPETWTDPDTGQVVSLSTFTLTYTVGIDYLADPDTRPIRRYVTAAAMNSPELAQRLAAAGGRGPVANVSVSTEGQSKTVTYGPMTYGGGGEAGKDSPGALPSRATLDRWRIAGRRVVQAPDLGYDARLHAGSTGVPYRDREGFWNLP